MAPPKNNSIRFYKFMTRHLWTLLGHSLDRNFELESVAAQTNQENAQLHQENSQLHQENARLLLEISTLRNRDGNLTSNEEPSISGNAIPHSSISSETAPEHVNLHHSTRRSNHIRDRQAPMTSQTLIDISDVDEEQPDSPDNAPEEETTNPSDDDSYALPHTPQGYSGSDIDNYLQALALQEAGWAARARRRLPNDDDRVHELFERARLARAARQPTFGPLAQIQQYNVPINVRGHYNTGIQYNPPSGTQNIYRTIVVSGLPSKVQLADVVDVLETGDLFSSQLLNTVTLAGTRTVRIVYVTESDARRTATNAMQAPQVLQFNGHQARAILLCTPTYPIGQATMARINDTSNPATRRIQVYNLDANMDLQAFVDILEAAGYRGHHVDGFQHFCRAPDDSVYVTFDSVHGAVQVHDELQRSGAKVRFVSRTEYEAQGF